ncbi:lipoprotein signal peptidase [Xylanibacter oryzae]|uniref:lipoprotein signal peptidase n=1 Tax=Xylanibacter oryzae TaxID=185293 RepID=UPI0004AD9F20|nr:lipoprotein signal peptidase [Xylanibacter oryzae]
MKKGNRFLSDGKISLLVVLVVLVIDQMIKIWVKTHMCLHESIHVTDWFYIYFIENNGMAYGIQLFSKIFLSLFRVVAVLAIGYYISIEIKKKAKLGYIVCLSMILAGAAGNIFDSLFYGLIFNGSSEFYASYFVPFGTGYSSFLMGKVVDMFYFPIIQTTWPTWMPLVGGHEFIFFSPIFNFADATISVGVVFLLLLYRKELSGLQFSFNKNKSDRHTDKEEK